MSRRSTSLFGGANTFSKAQLPTYQDVGEHFQQTKLDLQSDCGTKVLLHDVTKKVNGIEQSFTTRPIVISRVLRAISEQLTDERTNRPTD